MIAVPAVVVPSRSAQWVWTPVELLPAPGDHLHRGGAAPVGAHLLGHPAGAEDRGALRVVAGRLGPRGRGFGGRGWSTWSCPGPRSWCALASGWTLEEAGRERRRPRISWRSSHDLGDGARGLRSARRARRRRGRRGRAPAVRRMLREDVEVARGLVAVGRAAQRPRRGGGAGPHLGGVAGGPAGAEAVPLARRSRRTGPGRAASCSGACLALTPAERQALVDDPVDLALEVRGDGPVADRRRPAAARRASARRRAAGRRRRRRRAGRRERLPAGRAKAPIARVRGRGIGDPRDAGGRAGSPTVPNNPRKSQVHHWSQARAVCPQTRALARKGRAGWAAAVEGRVSRGVERTTRLELATSTLGRSRSTN